jgi:hypothetical protein
MSKKPEHFGTIDYIEEMDKILDELSELRRGLGNYERKERFTITKAMESIRALKERSKRHGLKIGLMSEDDIT